MKNKNFKLFDKKLIRKVNKVIKHAKKCGATSTDIMSTEIPFAPVVVCNWGRGDELRVLVKFNVHGNIASVDLEIKYKGNDSLIGDIRNFTFSNYAYDMDREEFALGLGGYSFSWEKFYECLFRRMKRYIVDYYYESVKLEAERANSLAEELRDCRECWKTIRATQVTTVPESPQVPAYRYPWGCS